MGSNTRTPSGKNRKTIVLIAGIVLLIAVIVVIGTGIAADKSVNDSEVREAFEGYIDRVVAEADDFDTERHPVYAGVTTTNYIEGSLVEETCDEIWLSYAIDDFDGDGQAEMMVHRDYLGISEFADDTLCMFEYEDGSIAEGRQVESNMFPSEGTTDFYQTAVAIKCYDSGSYDVLLFNDDFSERYGDIPGKNTVMYSKDDESGNYELVRLAHYHFGEPIGGALTPEEVEEDLASLHTSKDGTLLEPMRVDFRDIQAEPKVSAEKAKDEEEAALLSRISELYPDGSGDVYPSNYCIEDFDNDGSKECILYTVRNENAKIEGCFDSPDDDKLHQSSFPMPDVSAMAFDEIKYYNNGIVIGKILKGNLYKEYVYVYPVIRGNATTSDIWKELGAEDDQYIHYCVGYDDKEVYKRIIDSSNEEPATLAAEEVYIGKEQYLKEISLLTGGAEEIDAGFHTFDFTR